MIHHDVVFWIQFHCQVSCFKTTYNVRLLQIRVQAQVPLIWSYAGDSVLEFGLVKFAAHGFAASGDKIPLHLLAGLQLRKQCHLQGPGRFARLLSVLR